jgi:hypothetical protein
MRSSVVFAVLAILVAQIASATPVPEEDLSERWGVGKGYKVPQSSPMEVISTTIDRHFYRGPMRSSLSDGLLEKDTRFIGPALRFINIKY